MRTYELLNFTIIYPQVLLGCLIIFEWRIWREIWRHSSLPELLVQARPV